MTPNRTLLENEVMSELSTIFPERRKDSSTCFLFRAKRDHDLPVDNLRRVRGDSKV